MKGSRKSLVSPVAVIALLVLVGCGGASLAPPVSPPTTYYTIGGTVSGLTGTGLLLQDNVTDLLAVSVNGSFQFVVPIASGTSYKVTASPPLGQACTVTNGTGIANANVTNVQVSCVNSGFYSVGGVVLGLAGDGLVLQDNSGDNLTINSNGAFTFATPIINGGSYAVTVLTQPSTPPTCTVENGSGTSKTNVTNVAVICGAPPQYTVGGTVTGLSGSGLVLQDNGGNNLSITTSGSFTFSGSAIGRSLCPSF